MERDGARSVVRWCCFQSGWIPQNKASTLLAMASTLLAMASNLIAMASKLIVVACNLLESAGFSRRVLWMFLLLLLLCCKSFPYARIFAHPPPSPLYYAKTAHTSSSTAPRIHLHPRSVRPKDRSRLQHGAPSSCHASNLSAKMPNSSIDKQLPCVPLQAFSTPSFQTRAQIATNMCLSSACLLFGYLMALPPGKPAEHASGG